MTRAHHARAAAGVDPDFRGQLIIDRHDPILLAARQTRRKHHTPSEEDAVAWNVFRSLRQVDSAVWLPELFRAAFPRQASPHCERATVDLWRTISAPPGLQPNGDDADCEVDVLIETPQWVWVVDARLHADGARATPRADRDQIVRLVDVGSFHAGVRRFFFSLLVPDRARAEPGVTAVTELADLPKLRELLRGHRPDGLTNLSGVSVLTWQDLHEVLADAADAASREEERAFAARAHAWLGEKALAQRSA
jgi:hypothetical protein